MAINPTEILSQIDADLQSETSGGGTFGVYQDIWYEGKLLRKGHRNIKERLDVLGSYFNKVSLIDKTVVDLGCNLGQMCQGLRGWGTTKTLGLDKSEKFVKWAKILAPSCDFMQADLNIITPDQILQRMDVQKVDVVLCLAVWDYIETEKMVQLLKTITGEYLVFEGHSDGLERMKNSIAYQGRMLDSWEVILKQKLGYKEPFFAGWVDNKTRPIFICTR